MTSNEKLTKLRKSLELTQEEFGARISVSKQYISEIETGRRNVGLKFLKKVSEAFKVPVASLLGEDEKFVITEGDESLVLKLLSTASQEEKSKILSAIYRIRKVPLREIPVLGYVQAGEPLELVDITEPIDIVLIPESEAQGAEFAVIVRGDSMIEKGVYSGDKLLVSNEESAQPGDLVIAIIDNKATFKTFRRVDDKIFLEPANNHYEPIEITPRMEVRLLKVKMVMKNV
jgi:SOS-response transcriptional repressor LexA